MFHVEPPKEAICLARPKDHLVTQALFEVWLDPHSQIAQTHPRPAVEQLANYYLSEEYISHGNQGVSILDKIYAIVQKGMFAQKKKWGTPYLSAKKTHLDFGCGTGALVDYLQKNGWDAHGVEPSDKARSVLSNPKIVNSLENLPEKQFDIIALWHVLEHLPEPMETLRQLIGLLSTNGKLFIAVPNYKSWDANHYNDFWAAYDVPRHLWHFSYEGLNQLAQALNLKIVLKKGLFFDALYVAYLSEKHKGRACPLLRGVIKGLLSNGKALFTGEHSSLLVVLEKTN